MSWRLRAIRGGDTTWLSRRSRIRMRGGEMENVARVRYSMVGVRIRSRLR